MPRKKQVQPKDYNEPFPTRLRSLMEENSKTQQDIADYLEITRQAVSFYADGQTSPNWKTIVKIANFFHISTDYLLGLSEFKPANEDSRMIYEHTGLSENAIRKLTFMHKMGQSEEIEILSALIDNPFSGVALQQAAQYIAIAKDCTDRDNQFRELKGTISDDDYYTLHAISDEIIQSKSGVLSRELQAPEIGTLFKLSSIDSMQSAFKDVLKGLINNGTNR